MFSARRDHRVALQTERYLSMSKIDGIDLPVGLAASLGGSPEDAAKAFMRAASEGLAQVMADSLTDAIGASVGAGPAPDWTKLVRSCAVNLAWETPPGTPVQTVNAFFTPSSAVGGGSVSVSIGISASF